MNSRGTLETFVPLVFRRQGIRRLADTDAVAHDPTLIEAVARATHWQCLLDSGEFESGASLLAAGCFSVKRQTENREEKRNGMARKWAQTVGWR